MSIVGIAVGVAMVAGVDLATTSASRAFQISAETISGRATHFLIGPGGSLETEVYRMVRVDLGLRASAPVVEGFVRTEGGTFRLLGIDPLSGEATGTSLAGFPEPAELLTTPGAVVISSDGARRLGVTVSDTLRATTSGRDLQLIVKGVVSVAGSEGGGWADLLVGDIATAQEALGLTGQLSRIELYTSDEEARRVSRSLGSAVDLVRPESRTAALGQMTAAFDTNLQALSYLALVVGMFLIFNIMSFSVVQRRPVYSRLRATGVPRRLIARSVLAEAALLGVVGSALGVALGAILGQGLVNLVTRAINDLYFVVSVREMPVGAADLARAFGLGIGASLLSAWIPARQAASVPAADALRRSGEEDRFQARIGSLGRIGAALILVGYGVVRLPLGIWGGYLGLLLVIVGFSLVGPSVIRSVVGWTSMLRLPLIGRMALRGIQTQMSRTSLAIVALSVAVSAAIGVGVMVDSFRGTVVEWLDMTLRADLYVSPPSAVARLGDGLLAAESLAALRAHPEVEEAYGVRRVPAQASDGPVSLVVIEHGPRSQKSYRFVETTSQAPWASLEAGAVYVSEPFGSRRGVAAGDTLVLTTAMGPTPVPVAAVYVDYGSDVGTVLMDRSVYEGLFDDRSFNGLALYLKEGAVAGRVGDDLRRETAQFQSLLIQSNQSLRAGSLEIFDRTFAITWVLQILALIVAVIGVISALSAIQLERAWEFAVQRAIGLRRGTLVRLIILQSALMGALAGLLAMPLGIALASGLVYVINQRSFGWSLSFRVDPAILMQALLVSVAAAVIAALVPARAARSLPLASRLKGGTR